MSNLLNKMQDNKAITIIIAVIILALATTGIVYAVNANKPTEPEPTPKVVEEEKEEYISTISVDLTGVDVKDVAIPAEIEIILDAKAEVLDNESLSVTDTVLKLDELNDIAELPEGDYQLHMLATPIEVNGSTYKLPETGIDFTVKEDLVSTDTDIAIADDEAGFLVTYDTNTVLITIVLERIDVEDMTKEQLIAVATRIEAEKPEEYKELVADLNTRAETAPSDPESAKDVEVPSESEGASPVTPTPTPSNPDNGNTGNTDSNNNGNTNTGGNTGGNNNSGGGGNHTTPTQPPAHTHSFVMQYRHHDAIGEQGYTETVPAVTQNETWVRYSDGREVPDGSENHSLYSAQNGVSYQRFTKTVTISEAYPRYVKTADAVPAWDEPIGEKCSCGATR